MDRSSNPYKRHRFPPAIIQYAVWLYHHLNISQRDIQDPLAERGIEASCESVRVWCNMQIPRHVGPAFHVMPGRDSTACRATVPR